jgi:secondary thiamine-phosphate synthase enzyme
MNSMKWFKETLQVQTHGKGLYPFEDVIQKLIRQWQITEGMCYLFVQHTSASLVINENYDPTARMDLEAFMDHLVPENQSWFEHTLEGRDDSPSHIRTMITHPSLTIPIDDGRLNLGTWQGVFLFEHRTRPMSRKVLIRCLDMSEN